MFRTTIPDCVLTIVHITKCGRAISLQVHSWTDHLCERSKTKVSRHPYWIKWSPASPNLRLLMRFSNTSRPLAHHLL